MMHITEDDILDFLSESPQPQTKRDITRAFGIKGDDRIPFKRMLRKMEKAGQISKEAGGRYGLPDALPPVGVIEISEIDLDGDVLAILPEWQNLEKGSYPRIELVPGKKGHIDVTTGERVLARLKRLDAELYEAEIIRKLDAPQNRLVGVVTEYKRGFALQPVDKKARNDFVIPDEDLNGATVGDIALAEIQPDSKTKRKKARILEIYGKDDDARAISIISLHEVGLRSEFPKAVIEETEKMAVPPLGKRSDLRDLPLVTIDGADARDFDDAVYAQREKDGGFHLIVAIADVSYYVRPGTHLNREAYARGNSTYFPDRVVPMLPEALSNDLCSLRPHEDRACMAMHMWIDKHANLTRYKVERALMKSTARLTYEQVQAAKDGIEDETTKPLMKEVIHPLYEAYESLWQAREKRGALELDLPERQIIVSDKGEVTDVRNKERLDAHKLIEEFMILANVAAAQALEAKEAPCVYRVHEKPDMQKLNDARLFIKAFGIDMPRAQIFKPAEINAVLKKAEELPYAHLIHKTILRTQSQARYDMDNCGHFGLALKRYGHFTSPIRRYADLLVHRSLVKAYKLGEGGLSDEENVRMDEMCDHISTTERTSMDAERSAKDRFAAQYLSQQTEAEFTGTISGVSRFGLFVTLDESGADGIIPIRTLPDDFYIHDEKQHALIGRQTGRLYRMGAKIITRLVEADPMTGSTVLSVVGKDGADIPGINMPEPKISQGRNRRPGKKGKPGGRHRGKRNKNSYTGGGGKGKKGKGKNNKK